MGFEKILLGAAFNFFDKKTGGKLSNHANNVQRNNSNKMDSVIRLSKMMDRYSDEELKNIYQTDNGDRKYAAGYLLKQRGY